ncbi:MAG: hypothetical protein Pg6A_13270 [Termitinemataceae bacterium]|nr:MAG: hypothetical protein Pg6A_13270 [Termitinemataceae bacterium]
MFQHSNSEKSIVDELQDKCDTIIMNQELDYIYWKDDGWFVGFLEDYPDYVTQGETREELEDMLRSLYSDINTFDFSFVRQRNYGANYY